MRYTLSSLPKPYDCDAPSFGQRVSVSNAIALGYGSTSQPYKHFSSRSLKLLMAFLGRAFSRF